MRFVCLFRQYVFLFIFLVLLISHSAGQKNISPEDLLSEYVQIESVTGHEKAAAEFLMRQCEEAGLHVTVFSSNENSFNFSASLYPLEMGKPNILLLNHCDVVDPGEISKWTYPPFSGEIADSAVWGRGSIDNKAMGIMQFMAIRQFVEQVQNEDFPYNISLLTVSNEEKGGTLGAGLIIQKFIEQLHPYAVFGEGGTGTKHVLYSEPEKTVFGISIAGKQGAWFEMSMKNGSAGHGCVSQDANIVNQMVCGLNKLVHQKKRLVLTDASKRMMKSLASHEKGFFRMALRHPGFFLPLVKKRIASHEYLSLIFFDNYNITGLYSPESAANSIPNEIRATLDCRFLKPVDPAEIERKIRATFNNSHLSVRLLGASQPASCSIPDQYYKWLERAILKTNPDVAIVPILFPAISDNNYFQNKAIPTYGLLPCILNSDLIKGIHNIDEHIPVSCLYQGIDIYSELIRQAISGTVSAGK